MKDKIAALSKLKSAISKKTPKDISDYMASFKDTDEDPEEQAHESVMNTVEGGYDTLFDSKKKKKIKSK
jgi:hypothetical protein